MLVTRALFVGFCLSSAAVYADLCERSFVEFEIIAAEPQHDVFLRFSEYLLNGFSRDRSCKVDLASGRVRCASLDAPGLTPGPLKFADLRDYYQEKWLESRIVRGHDVLIPATAAEFEGLYNFRNWPKTIIKHSAIKQEQRTIYRNPDRTGPRLSVAETASGGELELAIESAKGSGSFEFYVYGSEGHLSNAATFPVGTRPAPGICVACHFNAGDGKVNRFIPILP